jgi:hypothetical protein
MAMYAQTDIKYGAPDGSTQFFAQGEEVTDLPDDVVDNLKEAGALGDQPPLHTPEAVTDFVASKDAEIARLTALLAEHDINPDETVAEPDDTDDETVPVK